MLPEAGRWSQALAAQARQHVDTLCAGRTHGIHAEPTTFGIKLAGFAFEADRERPAAGARVRPGGGRRGLAARSAPTRPPRPSSRRACWHGSGLEREPVSTQVVARDRHAELLQAIALAGAGMERFATELRHLARTEVGEVRSRSARGQKGSSSMPHKRNPIKSEQVVGLARVLRGNASAAVEDVALWHERDISHSSVERVILPDSTILLDHMQRRVLGLVRGDGRRHGADAREPGADLRGAVLAAGAAGAGGGPGAPATTPTASSSGWRSRRSTSACRCATCWPADPAGEGIDLDAIFDYAPFVRYAAEIVARLDEIVPDS